MKCKSFCWLAILLSVAPALWSQTTYNVEKDITYSASKIPTSCYNCTIHIAAEATLTLDQDIYLQNSYINGGNIDANNKTITLWTEDGFSGTSITFSKKGSLVSAATLSIEKSQISFYNHSSAIIYSTVDMIQSNLKLFDNSSFQSTGGAFNLKEGSTLTAGDGSGGGGAYIKFNGGTLNEYDRSYVSMGGFNNYYFNWSPYNAVSNGKSMVTTNNKLNCGPNGKNDCSSPMLYGPATLNGSGVGVYSTLPVILSSMNLASGMNKIIVTWQTAQESHAAFYQVERSVDGINWQPAGTVSAKGNTAVSSDYSFTDEVKSNGRISYRIKIVDADQSFEYSPVKSINVLMIHEMNIYPNPAKDYVVVFPKDGQKTAMHIELLSVNGKILKQLTAEGNKYVSLNEIKTGNYLLKTWEPDGAVQVFHLAVKK